MSIVKKVDGESKVIANKSVIDHNQLANRDAYGSHSIGAIRKLPEKLTALKNADIALKERLDTLETKVDTISDNNVDVSDIRALQEDIDAVELSAKGIGISVSNNIATFTDFENNTSTFNVGNEVDDDTIELDAENKLELKKVYTSSTFSGLGTSDSPIALNVDNSTIKVRNNTIRSEGIYDLENESVITASSLNTRFGALSSEDTSIRNLIAQNLATTTGRDDNQDAQILALQNRIEGLGGYIASNNFGSATPSQSSLNTYAIQQLANVTQASEIPDQTKVKNSFDGHVWLYNNHTGSDMGWVDNGTDTVSIATNEIAGVVKSSTNEWEGAVDVVGHVTINGLEEKYEDIETALGSLSSDITDNYNELSSNIGDMTNLSNAVSDENIDNVVDALKEHNTRIDLNATNVASLGADITDLQGITANCANSISNSTNNVDNEVVLSLSNHVLSAQLNANISNRLGRLLVIPAEPVEETTIPTIELNNIQGSLKIGDGLQITNGELRLNYAPTTLSVNEDALYSTLSQLLTAGREIVSIKANNGLIVDCTGVETETTANGTTFNSNSATRFNLPIGTTYRLTYGNTSASEYTLSANINAKYSYYNNDYYNLQSGVCDVLMNVSELGNNYDITMDAYFVESQETTLKTVACKSNDTYSDSTSAMTYTIYYL